VTSGGGIPDPRWASSEPVLVERIRDEILAASHGRITFARFMERAVTEPDLGYYASSTLRPTREGDFLTAPELHPLFGRCLARHLTQVWRKLPGGAPEFVVREWGAGRGTLESSVRAGLAHDDPDLAGILEWQPVDIVGRHTHPPTGTFEGVVLSNEFVDALPVHRVVGRGSGLAELHVTWQDGWFAHAEGPPSTAALAEHLAADGVTLADGQLAEVGLAAAAWVGAAVRDLARGQLLVIDYGLEASELYGPRRMAGTLMTYAGHRAGDDPFAAVGRQDITAHVDLTALDRAVTAAGLERGVEMRQGEYLASLGLGELLVKLGQDPATTLGEYAAARSAVARLLDPRHLGGFAVRAWERGRTSRERVEQG
jgi:SAM-dependent MidA family methyltransferase